MRDGDGWRTERVAVGAAELHAPGAVLRVVVGPGQPLVLPLRGVMPQPVAVTRVPVALDGAAAPAVERIRRVRWLAAGRLPAAVLGTAIGEAIEATDLAGAWAHLSDGRARNAAARNELHFGVHGDGALPPRWSADGVMLAHDGGDGGLYASLLARAPWVPEPTAPAASVRLWDAERLTFAYPGEARHAALLAGDVAPAAEATGLLEELAVPAWGPPRSLSLVGMLDAGGVTLRTAASPLPPWPAPDAGAWSLAMHSDGHMHREAVVPVATDGDGLTFSARVPWPNDPDASIVLPSPDGDVRGEWSLAEVLR